MARWIGTYHNRSSFLLAVLLMTVRIMLLEFDAFFSFFFSLSMGCPSLFIFLKPLSSFPFPPFMAFPDTSPVLRTVLRPFFLIRLSDSQCSRIHFNLFCSCPILKFSEFLQIFFFLFPFRDEFIRSSYVLYFFDGRCSSKYGLVFLHNPVERAVPFLLSE